MLQRRPPNAFRRTFASSHDVQYVLGSFRRRMDRRGMCVVSSGTWRRNSASGARTVPCTIPKAAVIKRRNARRSSNDDSPGSFGYVEEKEETGVQVIRRRVSKPVSAPTSPLITLWEEFILGSAISPEDELGIEELLPSESSAEAIDSQPEMKIASLVVESQPEESSTLEEPTSVSSLTSLEAEAYPSEYTEEALTSELAEEEAIESAYEEEAVPSDDGEEEAIESASAEELAMASGYGVEAMASDLSEESAEGSSPSLPSRRRIRFGEDDDLEEYTARALDEAFADWESTAITSTISAERPSASSAAMLSASVPAADLEEHSIPSLPILDMIYERMSQESLPSQTEDEEVEALECTRSPEVPPKGNEDPLLLPWETTAPPSTSEEEDSDSAEAWDRVPISPSPKIKTVIPEVSDAAEGVGHIDDPLPATSIETEDERLALPLDTEGFGTLSDTEECIQRAQGPPGNVPCQTKQIDLPVAKTEPRDEIEDGDTDTEEKEGSALLSPPIAEGEAQQDPTQEPAAASEPPQTEPLFGQSTYHRPQISETEELSNLPKPSIAQKIAKKSKKTKRTPHFPQSSPSATAAEADRERSTGPAVTYPKHKSPVYQTQRRSGQQPHRSSDAGTYVTSGMSHLDQAWAQKDYSKTVETETGHIRFDRDEIRRYGRWKPAETQYTAHQPYRFEAETSSTNKCIVYRRIPCGKSHTLSHSFVTVAIGKPNISRNACRARGCCWLEISKQYWKRGCFQPTS